MDWLWQPEVWIALLTLTAMEIVLGIDNLVFVSIVSTRLPPDRRRRGRLVGLSLAMVARVLLLLSLAWIARLQAPIATVLGLELSWHDLILIAGGLFLLMKGTHEIHQAIEGDPQETSSGPSRSFLVVMVQIVVLDLVFSLDSVITAIGMANQVPVMVAAIILAVGVMLVASAGISAFVAQHPTIRLLALSFLLLIGVSLVADGLGQHIPKGYIYFAMGFSVLVEAFNLRAGHRRIRPHNEAIQVRPRQARHNAYRPLTPRSRPL